MSIQHPNHDLTTICRDPVLDRFTVPGGWLYRTTASFGTSYSVAMAFVPAPEGVNTELLNAAINLLKTLYDEDMRHSDGAAIDLSDFHAPATELRVAIEKATGVAA